MYLDNPKNIELSHKNLIKDLYEKYGNGDSAHSFESLFIWKEDMDLSLVCSEDIYSIRDNSTPGSWFFPVGSEEGKTGFISELFKRDSFSLSYMTEEDVSFLKKHFPGRFDFEETPDRSEYIMDREIMENLPGGSFSKDRGHINKLLKNHSFETVPVRSVDKMVLFEIIAGWDASKHNYESIPDESATKNILNNLDNLGLEGIVLVMDDVPCSVCAGFKMTADTVDCVIQKNRVSEQGLTYYLRQEFARSQPESVKFFNWEEDLGIEGLRRAKMLMRPVRMINMFTGRPNE